MRVSTALIDRLPARASEDDPIRIEKRRDTSPVAEELR